MYADVARLQSLDTGTESYLRARFVVGRAALCNLRISDLTVSALHAQITWDGNDWYVRDMNSTNGTFLDGRRLGAAELAPLRAGATLAFGALDHAYRVLNVSAPRLMATVEDGESIVAETDVLCLPSPEVCELTIFRDSTERWLLESPTGTRLIEDQESVSLGTRNFCISLPGRTAQTHEQDAQRWPSAPTLRDYTLVLHVSRDGEQITAELMHEQRTHALEYRAHNQLLLELARTRVYDISQAHLPESEHGWMYRDDLLTQLKLDLPHLNIWIYRARQQLTLLNIPGAGSIFERRVGTRQLRIGMSKLCIS